MNITKNLFISLIFISYQINAMKTNEEKKYREFGLSIENIEKKLKSLEDSPQPNNYLINKKKDELTNLKNNNKAFNMLKKIQSWGIGMYYDYELEKLYNFYKNDAESALEKDLKTTKWALNEIFKLLKKSKIYAFEKYYSDRKMLDKAKKIWNWANNLLFYNQLEKPPIKY